MRAPKNWPLWLSSAGALMSIVASIAMVLRHEVVSPFVLILADITIALQIVVVVIANRTIAIQEKRIELEKDINRIALLRADFLIPPPSDDDEKGRRLS